MDEMNNALFTAATTQGLWASLAIALIFYNIKYQKERDKRQDLREDNYQKLVSSLVDQSHVLDMIKKSIEDIHNYLKK